ncbi:UDP-glucosyl transferase 85A3, partial [Prunus dulcis]
FNHRRFLKSLGPDFLDGLPDFRFETIPDGLPESDKDATQDPTLLCESFRNFLIFFKQSSCRITFQQILAPFLELLVKLNETASSVPPVTCIVSDGFLSMFTITAAEELGIPVTLFYTVAASSFMGFKQYRTLMEKDLSHSKLFEKRVFGQGHDDVLFNFCMEATDKVDKASAVVFLTFDALEKDGMDALSSMLIPSLYTIGPIQLLLNQIPEDSLSPIGYSLWKEETECLQWLNSKAPNSVVYVNFGSVAVMRPQHLVEFGWGLANSKFHFFWVIRPDLVIGESAYLPPEFVAETKERGLIASWCPQEEVLNHPSVGGFLTHSGWNSTMESLTAEVPMLCWPFYADQQTNCYYTCNEWSSGMQIDNDVKRDGVEMLVRELMEGEKGKKMKKKAKEWKKLAETATDPHGSSSINLDNLVDQVLLRKD